MHINWLAFAVAVVAQMIIGFIYFNPKVMGNYWAKANGKTLDELDPSKGNMAVTMIMTIVYTLLITMFMCVNVTGFGQEELQYHTFKHGVFHAIVLTIMVVIPMFGTPTLYERRSSKWLICHTLYWFLRAAVAMGIMSAWR